ncbi:hypothetical protein ACHGLA_14575 [Streptomyces sp. YH02]|uniref:hypothetical protein n=1 Tax=Streptomyces sp. YH02 TaxID=3256999 RepID=UPI00375648C6
MLTATGVVVTLPAPADAAVGQRARATDVNGDGVGDFVVASAARLNRWTAEPLGTADLGGSVHILPGGQASRPTPALISQDGAIPGTPEREDAFGQSVATGDFDNDGKADVAVGNPHETVGAFVEAGTVAVQYGQSTAPYVGAGKGGLTGIEQNAVDATGVAVPGDNEAGDRFGASLTTGYFNGDDYADLAIGAPGEAVGTALEAGRVTVLYGGPTGLTAAGAKMVDGTVAGAAEPFDHFGASLAAADLRDDGHDDLAVLASGEHLSGTRGAWGAAMVLRGTASGIDSAGAAVVNVNHTRTTGHLRALVAGRFHGSAYADLAVFADQSPVASPAPNSGVVVVTRGGSTGISPAATPALTVLAASAPEAGAYWGGALSAGDVNGDGLDELAVGALRARGTGSVTVFTGDPAGLTARPSTTLTEDTAPLSAVAKQGEGFGYTVALQDLTGDGRAELLAGAPWEDATAPVARTLTTGAKLFELGLTITGSEAPALVSAKPFAGASASAFGPGVGNSAGVTVLTENAVEPSPWLNRLPPLN